ncbi:MAG: hypothetical protein ACD_76C00044G0001 [uncultured bacterium]|nr:MAG: hypothetical protein ACD_76C00044G0001 [uncultured bacterium]HBD05180.1 hypothetical protein [Candidatus Uhrbacteria bacterium]
MYIEKLEIQGFKTFAKKTILKFLPPTTDKYPMTAVVGPNGSGKSNISDAIRWALGEQSLKVLRGKKGEDIIFAGSSGKSRSGFAEVILTFNNEDKTMPIEASQIEITRRIYRDGESEYLLNGQNARHGDIQLLLAQANVGQRSYSIISQGMIDHVLVATPEERKDFFDDATGVKQFQIKRHNALNKLRRTFENLAEAEMLLNEIDPRLKSLKRQVGRLEKRADVERELQEIQERYYSTLWSDLNAELQKAQNASAKAQEQRNAIMKEIEKIESELSMLEGADLKAAPTGMSGLQSEYKKIQQEISRIKDEHFDIEKQIEISKIEQQVKWAPLPLGKIIEELNNLRTVQDEILAEYKNVKTINDLPRIEKKLDEQVKSTKDLLSKLQKPNKDEIISDPRLVAKIKELDERRAKLEASLKKIEDEIDQYAQKEQENRSKVFEIQRRLREKQTAMFSLDEERNRTGIEAARVETQMENLVREINEQLREHAQAAMSGRISERVDTASAHEQIQKLKFKLELIGGIDPEIIKEYEETKTRFEFLDEQIKDLRRAMKDTERIIDELDEQIQKQSKNAFNQINKEFQRYFKILFGGGSCGLEKLTGKQTEEQKDIAEITNQEGAIAQSEQKDEDELAEFKKRVDLREQVVGVEILACPPGKVMKDLNLLSGGEKALTSIALLSAIMSTNPSPFVVLDEVDAALDESNTIKFGGILEEQRQHTQFIVITHNRATMERADALYGVTMGDDGISNLLSVNLSDIEIAGTARR